MPGESQPAAEPTTPAGRRRARRKRLFRLVIFALLSFILLLYGSMIAIVVFGGMRSTNGPVCCDVPTDWGAQQYEDVAIASTDGVTLAGWYIPPLAAANSPANHSAIMLLHGYSGNRLSMKRHAAYLNAAGYGVLMIDLRGHGESIHDHRSLGWEDPADISALVAFLAQRPEVEHIGVLGFSSGARIAALAAADLPQIEALVLDGPSPLTGGDVRPLARKHALYVFWYVTYNLVDEVAERALGMDEPPAVVDALARITDRPVLVIAGAKERPEPDYGRAYRDALGDNGDLWLITGATHGKTWTVAEDYGARVVAFFDSALE